ncbi:MAG: 3-phosphoshikimate 1-carboxyvinyltransferase [Coriobacteriaceae bacterium]|nr:3-phosphoshikimate 1-carboxyvinyltransferase [Coriobacteriaceae bacterium]
MALTGTIRVPSDKSISHRAVFFAAIAKGRSHLRDLSPSADLAATIAAVRLLGADIDLAEGAHGLTGNITGNEGFCVAADEPLAIDCGNSGTTVRLLLGLLSGLNCAARLIGDESLSARPMDRVIEPLTQMGADIDSDGGHLPIAVKRRGASEEVLHPISYTTPMASAQVKSAILLAGLFAEGRTEVTEPCKSRDHTERLLSAFGADVAVDDLTVAVQGPLQLHAHDVTVPADPSSATFVAVAAALIEGSHVVLEDVDLNPTRIGAFEAMRRMGCDISWTQTRKEGSEPIGDVEVSYAEHLQGTTVVSEEVPTLIDEIPALSLLACFAEGRTVFEDVGELRVKECDRLAAIVEGLGMLGLAASAEGDDLIIEGSPTTLGVSARAAEVHAALREVGAEPSVLPCHHDHRLAMTWHLAYLVLGSQIRTDDPDCVSVSWPNFYDDIHHLEEHE